MKDSLKIYVLALICFVISISEYVIVGVLDEVASSTHITISAAGQLISVFAVAGAIGTPLAIMAMMNMDRRRIMIISLVLVVVGSVGMIIAPNYTVLLVSRALPAIGAGVFTVTCFAVAAEMAAPGRQAGAIATITMGFNTALIIGLPIGRFITAAYGWRAIFWGTGTLSALSIIAIAALVPATKGEKPMPLGKQLSYLRQPKVVLALSITFFWIAGYGILYSYITPFLKAVTTLGERSLSAMLLAFGLATLAGNKLGGSLGDRIGIGKSLGFSMAAHVIVLVLLSTITGSTIVTICLLIAWAIAAWIPGPVQQYNILSLAPEASGILLSLNSSVLQFGVAAGAAMGGVAASAGNIATLGYFGAIGVALAGIVVYFFSRVAAVSVAPCA